MSLSSPVGGLLGNSPSCPSPPPESAASLPSSRPTSSAPSRCGHSRLWDLVEESNYEADLDDLLGELEAGLAVPTHARWMSLEALLWWRVWIKVQESTLLLCQEAVVPSSPLPATRVTLSRESFRPDFTVNLSFSDRLRATRGSWAFALARWWLQLRLSCLGAGQRIPACHHHLRWLWRVWLVPRSKPYILPLWMLRSYRGRVQASENITTPYIKG